MPITLPLFGSDAQTLNVGKYRLTLVTSFADQVKTILDSVPKEVKISGKRVRFLDIRIKESGSIFTPNAVEVDFELLDNPVPVLAIVAGIGILLGLTAIAITAWKVSAIIDNPAAIPAVYWFLALLTLAGYLAYKQAKSKGLI